MGHYPMQKQLILFAFLLVNTNARKLAYTQGYEMSPEGKMTRLNISEPLLNGSHLRTGTFMPRTWRENRIANSYKGNVVFDIKEIYREADQTRTRVLPAQDYLDVRQLEMAFRVEYQLMQRIIANADTSLIDYVRSLYSGLLQSVRIATAEILIQILDSQRGGSWSATWLSQENWAADEIESRREEAEMFVRVLQDTEERNKWIANNFGESLLFFEAVVYSMGTMAIHEKPINLAMVRIPKAISEAIVKDAGELRARIEEFYPERKKINESQAFMDQAGDNSLLIKSAVADDVYTDKSLWVRVRTFEAVASKMRENWFFYRLGMNSNRSEDFASSLVSVGLRHNIPMGGHVSSSVGLLYASAKHLCGPHIVSDQATVFGALMMWPFHTSHSHSVAEVVAGLDIVHSVDARWADKGALDWPSNVKVTEPVNLMTPSDRAENIDRAEAVLQKCRLLGSVLLERLNSARLSRRSARGASKQSARGRGASFTMKPHEVHGINESEIDEGGSSGGEAGSERD